MADFKLIKEQGVWINLDYVVRIESNEDEAETASVVFADGTSFTLSHADSKRLARQLRPQKKKKKKKKKPEAPEASVVEESSTAPVDS